MENNIGMEKEVVVNLRNELGVLSRVTSALADAGINVNAICGYECENEAHVHLLTDNNAKAVATLIRAGFKTTERDVVKCELPTSSMHPEMESVLNGLEVENDYWCAADRRGQNAVLYFSIKDNIHPVRARIC